MPRRDKSLYLSRSPDVWCTHSRRVAHSKIQLSVRDPEDAAVTVSLAHQVQDFQAVSAVFLGNRFFDAGITAKL